MAQRPIFLVTDKAPYYRTFYATFEWNGGFAKSQKQKNINALHNAYNRIPLCKDRKLLEVSSASPNPDGVGLSAFNLTKYVPSMGKDINLECVFQAGKVFSAGGPYLELMNGTSREAKKDPRIRNSGRIVEFEFDGKRYPTEPKTAFYDWLYVNSCIENKEKSDKALEFDGFTDIEFNPEKSLNCQARSLAIFVALKKCGKLNDKPIEYDNFLKLISE